MDKFLWIYIILFFVLLYGGLLLQYIIEYFSYKAAKKLKLALLVIWFLYVTSFGGIFIYFIIK